MYFKNISNLISNHLQLFRIPQTATFGYTFSAGARYQEPCTHANIAANNLYHPYKFDTHKYIQVSSSTTVC